MGEKNAEIIEHKYFGGNGSRWALQIMLQLWHDYARNRSWQMIIDALKEMDKPKVIKSIEKEYRISVCSS